MTRVTPTLGAEWRAEDALKGLAQIDFAVRFRLGKSGNADRVAVDIVLRNNSDTPIFFEEQSPDWDYELDIAGSDGQSRVELTNFGKCVYRIRSSYFATSDAY